MKAQEVKTYFVYNDEVEKETLVAKNLTLEEANKIQEEQERLLDELSASGCVNSCSHSIVGDTNDEYFDCVIKRLSIN